MRTLRQLASLVLVVAAVVAVPLTSARAQQQGRVVIDTEVKAKKGLYPIAIPTPVAGDRALAKVITEVQSFDLGVSSWFRVLDPRSFLADLRAEDMGIDPARWKSVGAFGVIKARALRQGSSVRLQFKLYEVEKGAIPVLSKEYIGPVADVRRFVHAWCNDVVQHFTGEPGFFGSQLAFSANKKIYVVDFDGHGVRKVSNNSSINLLPAFSRDGTQIAYTSYMRRNPDLYLTTPAGSRARRIAAYRGMNTGAAWSPDGRTIALTLSRDGNPEIYLIRAADGAIVKRLTRNRYIDTSPSWSPDGREIAFVSNREGSPQIFVMNADGSRARRVSTIGSWNQTPVWSPKKGARVLAYTARDDVSGRFDIVTLDLANGKMTRITQNQGNNEEPAWAPNGHVLAFTSTRSAGRGIYLASADGTGEQRLVHRGRASSVDWGPVRRP